MALAFIELLKELFFHLVLLISDKNFRETKGRYRSDDEDENPTEHFLASVNALCKVTCLVDRA